MIQNFEFTLEPGESRFLTFGAVDFVFCRLADVPVEFIVNQQTMTLETGGEYEHRQGMFDQATIRNPSTTRPVTVKLKMGTSRYRQVIIQGEVVVDPRVKTATGEFVSDQRAEHAILVTMDYKREPAITEGDQEVVASYGVPSGLTFWGADGLGRDGENLYTLLDYSTKTLLKLAIDSTVAQAITLPKRETGAASSASTITVSNGQLYVADTDGAGTTYIYQCPLSGIPTEWTEAHRIAGPYGGTVEGLAVLDNGDVYAMVSNGDVINVASGAVAFTVSAVTSLAVIGAAGTALLEYYSSQVFVYELVSGQWTKTRTVGTDLIGLPSGMNYNPETGRWLVIDQNTTTDEYDIIAIEPETIAQGDLHYGSATETCTRLPGLINPALLSEDRSTAAVTVDYRDGHAYVSGEVIKYVLDLLGIDTSGDYLDGITGVRASAKNREYHINLGGRTFSADGLEDNAQEIELPQVIHITALDTLWSNRL